MDEDNKNLTNGDLDLEKEAVEASKTELNSQQKESAEQKADRTGKGPGKKGNKEKKKNYFVTKYNEHMGEFKKIIWPSPQELVKQTVTTIVISAIFGAYICGLDAIFFVLYNGLVGLTK